jgi:mannobiose 2-epimerase
VIVRRVRSLAAAFLLVAALFSATRAKPADFDYRPPTRETYLAIAGETDAMLRRDVLDVWFPRTVDEAHGGFRSDFTREWAPAPSAGKFSVFQGRMTWVAARVATRRPELRDRFLPAARHGLDYLDRVMWDKEQGGFFWGLDDEGRVTDRYGDGKYLYGMSFCLYGAAAAYDATKEARALDLAKRAFAWIDAHAHDETNGGYFESLTRDGKVLAAKPETGRVELVLNAGFPIGYKSMNTHIHLLESFAELYRVWPDAHLRRRLEELLAIVRDRICVEPGAMNLYFTNAWRAIPGHDSYGHDVETAYLMLEAEEALGPTRDPRTARMARMLVDHALAYGWDETNGGFFREGQAYGPPEITTKEWWEQVEGLNALLLMHDLHGRESEVYFKAFQREWAFIRDKLVDTEHRGLWALVEPDGKPVTTVKAQPWKAAYHDGRALMNVSERLRRLAENSK